MARSNLVRALLLGALVLLLVLPALAGSLAIGRALMINPKLLILDEATEGLAPLVRAEIWRVLETLKRDGQAILLIDKNEPMAAFLASFNADDTLMPELRTPSVDKHTICRWLGFPLGSRKSIAVAMPSPGFVVPLI